MKRTFFIMTWMLCGTIFSWNGSTLQTVQAEDGSRLWLGDDYNLSLFEVKTNATESATVGIAIQELYKDWRLGTDVTLTLDKSLQLGGGYRVSVIPTNETNTDFRATVYADTEVGLLYGAYELLRIQNTGKLKVSNKIDKIERPFFPLRLLNHWDNLDGSVERGYAGESIWKWEKITEDIPLELRQRMEMYGRANASIGINGTVLNNVNASPKILTTEYLKKVKIIADILRPYGIKTYLSINFASPMVLGYTTTADPQNNNVQQWWKEKSKEIYELIPDFGGFLVKANSEGQPGPGDYGRSHADGANMLADALKPYGGIVMWRSFVYGANHKGEDRVKQAVSEFKPCDGKFQSNVILQSKNGPLDFQPREPYAPIFDQMQETPQMAELQITQEYLGQSKHLVFLAPMWKEFFSFVAPEQLVGIAGVANIGDNANWCGHPFSQANWYAYGRLAWNPQLTSEQIATEWIKQTFLTLHEGEQAVVNMMLTSRETCVDYMMPLGLHHIFKFDHHYGPEPDGFKAEYPIEWCPVYYHKADKKGIGFDRTQKSGTGATTQYREPYAGFYEHAETCPETYLLWFHHLPWKYKMKNGKTLWKNLCAHYNHGVSQVKNYHQIWKGIEEEIDADRFQQVDSLLDIQEKNAKEWRDVCLKYFQTFSKMPIDDK